MKTSEGGEHHKCAAFHHQWMCLRWMLGIALQNVLIIVFLLYFSCKRFVICKCVLICNMYYAKTCVFSSKRITSFVKKCSPAF